MDLSMEYWNSRYVNEKTGWDVGCITTPLKEYFDQIHDKNLKILIPGSGSGYEAEYLFINNFKNVFVLDYATTALKNFKKRLPKFPQNQIFDMNFFDSYGKFDLIIEQTFFCAIDINKRLDYISKMSELLVDKGKLVGLFFDNNFRDESPPYGATKNQYIDLLSLSFNIIIFEKCFNSIPSRSNNEFFCVAEKK